MPEPEIQAVIENNISIVQIVNENEIVVIREDGPISLITLGVQGPPGTDGQNGAASFVLHAFTNTNINIYYAVALDSSGFLIHADPTDLSIAGDVVGIAVQNGSPGGLVGYMSFGEIMSGMSITSGSNYYVGPGGMLVTYTTFPAALWQKKMGIGTSISSFLIQQKPTVIKD